MVKRFLLNLAILYLYFACIFNENDKIEKNILFQIEFLSALSLLFKMHVVKKNITFL